MKFTLSILLLFSNLVCFAGGMEVDTNVVVTQFPPLLYANIQYQPWAKGYLDVTKPPYNCAGNGLVDDTDNLQLAINDAYNCNLVVFLPAGKTFLVSKQLQCIASKSSRKFAFQLIGSTKGIKPIIKLKDGSIVSGNILITFQFVDPTTGNDPSRNYGATFRGIDINMGSNPAVSAISMDGAQYCTIEDVKIYGTQFNAGVWRLPGSGGGVVNLTVSGGNIGVLQDAYRPNPTICGLTLENQIQCGLLITNSRGPVVINGFKISNPNTASNTYRAISVSNSSSTTTNGIVDHGNANLCLTDGTVEVSGTSGLAFYNYAQDVTMNNVYVKSTQIIQSGAGSTPIVTIPGNTNQWQQITSFAFTSQLDKSSAFVNAINMNDKTANYQLYDPLITVTQLPVPDFTFTHSWANQPSWEDASVDITDPLYGATPENVNAKDDDRSAIQKAIDDVSNPTSANFGKVVFIPRGHFHIGSPLNLKSGVRMIGAGKFISVIQAENQWFNSLGAVIQSESNASGSLLLSDFAILGFNRMPLLLIKTANSLIHDITTELTVRDVKYTEINQPLMPYIGFSDNAGGKVYGICTGQLNTWWDADITTHIPGFNMLSVKNTTKPLTFYHPSIEHAVNSPAVLFDNAKHTTINSFKYELPHELVNINNSDSISIIGGSGNFQLTSANDRAIIFIKNSTNILIQNLDRKSLSTWNGNPISSDITPYWILNGNDKVKSDNSVLMYKFAGSPSSVSEYPANDTTLKVRTNSVSGEVILSEIYPNDKIAVYNTVGMNVWNDINDLGNSEAVIKTDHWVVGVYIVRVNNQSGKFLKCI